MQAFLMVVVGITQICVGIAADLDYLKLSGNIWIIGSIIVGEMK